MCIENIAGRFFGLVTKHACDRRTDGQNYDCQDRASIAASRGKNRCALAAVTRGIAGLTREETTSCPRYSEL